jgi:hypothetical protein
MVKMECESVKELVDRMSAYALDHLPDGWPAIQMMDVSALCNVVNWLANEGQIDLNNLVVSELQG